MGIRPPGSCSQAGASGLIPSAVGGQWRVLIGEGPDLYLHLLRPYTLLGVGGRVGGCYSVHREVMVVRGSIAGGLPGISGWSSHVGVLNGFQTQESLEGEGRGHSTPCGLWHAPPALVLTVLDTPASFPPQVCCALPLGALSPLVPLQKCPFSLSGPLA